MKRSDELKKQLASIDLSRGVFERNLRTMEDQLARAQQKLEDGDTGAVDAVMATQAAVNNIQAAIDAQDKKREQKRVEIEETEVLERREETLQKMDALAVEAGRHMGEFQGRFIALCEVIESSLNKLLDSRDLWELNAVEFGKLFVRLENGPPDSPEVLQLLAELRERGVDVAAPLNGFLVHRGNCDPQLPLQPSPKFADQAYGQLVMELLDRGIEVRWNQRLAAVGKPPAEKPSLVQRSVNAIRQLGDKATAGQ